jgi:hypothetical protein
MTEMPAAVTYASVVSKESVHIGLFIAALIDLYILLADIQNPYLTSPCQANIYTIMGTEFGANRQGKQIKGSSGIVWTQVCRFRL